MRRRKPEMIKTKAPWDKKTTSRGSRVRVGASPEEREAKKA